MNKKRDYFPPEGILKTGDIYSLLYHIYKHSISGLLIVETGDYEKQLVIEDRKIVFAASTLEDDALGKHLLKNKIIDLGIHEKTSQYMAAKKKRFGRALIELGYFSYEQIWTWIIDHLKTIVFSFFDIADGKYRLLPEHERDIENIVLDMDILDVLVEGIRRFKNKEFLDAAFADIQYLYIGKAGMLSQLKLKPFEMHVFDLVKRFPGLADIKECSELLQFDTMRLLYLFLVVEAISTEKKPQETKSTVPAEEVVGVRSFASFEEALRCYNMKYELIYKVLSKEIGPISLSLLLKAIEDIMENLPSYLQKIQFTPDGRIDEDTILKLVWYHDFNRTIGDFLRGLEEILYTEIYTVRRHLGSVYEQQVLRWINGIGN
ncbi:MAG: DUF4388 domain-containing protein [Acidobacteria bacterium]|jgi:hypothetical protein|nr:DUF4388 domain-containing protein [Acidobacteriota bacterium]